MHGIRRIEQVSSESVFQEQEWHTLPGKSTIRLAGGLDGVDALVTGQSANLYDEIYCKSCCQMCRNKTKYKYTHPC